MKRSDQIRADNVQHPLLAGKFTASKQQHGIKAEVQNTHVKTHKHTSWKDRETVRDPAGLYTEIIIGDSEDDGEITWR